MLRTPAERAPRNLDSMVINETQICWIVRFGIGQLCGISEVPRLWAFKDLNTRNNTFFMFCGIYVTIWRISFYLRSTSVVNQFGSKKDSSSSVLLSFVTILCKKPWTLNLLLHLRTLTNQVGSCWVTRNPPSRYSNSAQSRHNGVVQTSLKVTLGTLRMSQDRRKYWSPGNLQSSRDQRN